MIRASARDPLRRYLDDVGVQTGIHYPVPVHLQPAYALRPHGPGGLPVTERLRGEILSLPMHPYLSEEEVEEVCGALESWSGWPDRA